MENYRNNSCFKLHTVLSSVKKRHTTVLCPSRPKSPTIDIGHSWHPTINIVMAWRFRIIWSIWSSSTDNPNMTRLRRSIVASTTSQCLCHPCYLSHQVGILSPHIITRRSVSTVQQDILRVRKTFTYQYTVYCYNCPIFIIAIVNLLMSLIYKLNFTTGIHVWEKKQYT